MCFQSNLRQNVSPLNPVNNGGTQNGSAYRKGLSSFFDALNVPYVDICTHFPNNVRITGKTVKKTKTKDKILYRTDLFDNNQRIDYCHFYVEYHVIINSNSS